MSARRRGVPFRKVVPAGLDLREANLAFAARVAAERDLLEIDPSAPVPDIFVIGAMRAGTTNFCADLATHPHVVVPHLKEPWVLVRSLGRVNVAQSMYQDLYGGANASHQLLVDGSTSNSMLPQHPSVAGLASKLAPRARILYLVRDPVQRAISQFRHQLAWGVATHDEFAASIRYDSTFIDYGRYWWQLQPWLAAFGRDAIRVILFEEYTADRRRVVSDVAVSLGLDPSLVTIDEEAILNQSSDARMVSALWRSVLLSDAYQTRIRHKIPQRWRDEVSSRVLPRAGGGVARPSRDEVERIIQGTRQDAEALASFLGRTEPLWDLDATLRQFT